MLRLTQKRRNLATVQGVESDDENTSEFGAMIAGVMSASTAEQLDATAKFRKTLSKGMLSI